MVANARNIAAGLVKFPKHFGDLSQVRLSGSRRGWSNGRTIALLVLAMCGATASVALGTTYYAGVNGSTSNSGLSSSAPWPLDYACTHVGANNTLIVLPGTYTAGGYMIAFPNVTLKSQTRWGARLIGGTLGTGAYPSGAAPGLVIDGFEIGSTMQMGIVIYPGCDNCVIRNCWIHNTGLAGTQAGSAVEAAHSNGILIENNLIEYCGNDLVHNHCLYVSGTNTVVRNNITRYGGASGIAIGEEALGYGLDNLQVYNNLSYGNGNWALVIGGADMHRIYVHNNTLVGPKYAMGMGSAGYTLFLTNNILIGAAGVNNNWGSATLYGDYNIVSGYPGFSQSHGITSSSPGFVNPANGLYWLTSGSQARNAALSRVYGPVDFFGNAVSSVADIGAFQFNTAYASDTRVLDPSTSSGADYWKVLGGSSGGVSSNPPSSGFTFQASAGTLTAPFFVTNGYVCQSVDTVPPAGGRAVYNFTTTTAGVYVVTAVVNAYSVSHNSFYVTIDSNPSEPYNVWDIPVTSGFETRTVSWRGNGDGNTETDEFAPKAFALSAGPHSLVISGREPDTQLQSIQIQPTSLVPPSSAPVLRLLPAQ